MSVVVGTQRWAGSLTSDIKTIDVGYRPQIGIFESMGKLEPEEGLIFAYNAGMLSGFWVDDGAPSGGQPAQGTRRLLSTYAFPAPFAEFNDTGGGISGSPAAPAIAELTDVRNILTRGWEIIATTDAAPYPTAGQTLIYSAIAGRTLEYKTFDYTVATGFTDFDCGFDPMLVMFWEGGVTENAPFILGAWDRTRQFATYYIADDNARNGDGQTMDDCVSTDRNGLHYLEASAITDGVRLTAFNGGASGVAIALRDEHPNAGFRCDVVEWNTDGVKNLDGFGFTPEYVRIMAGWSSGEKGVDQGIFGPNLSSHAGNYAIGLATQLAQASIYTFASLGKYQAFDSNPILFNRDHYLNSEGPGDGFVNLTSIDNDGFTVATENPVNPTYSPVRFGYVAFRTSPALAGDFKTLMGVS